MARPPAKGGGWGVSRTVRKLVSKIHDQLGYSGYNENVYQERFWRKYPPRPRFAVTEDKVRGSEPKNHVQGIWTDTRNKYRLGIVPAPEGSGEDYFAVVLGSSSPIWQIGEIKGEIRTTATPLELTGAPRETGYQNSRRPEDRETTSIDGLALKSARVRLPCINLKASYARKISYLKADELLGTPCHNPG